MTTEPAVELLWLGYDGMSVPYADVVAVLRYQPALDLRIVRACGRVPIGVQAVVVTADGDYFPARWQVDQVRHSWATWRDQQRWQ